MKLLDVFNWDDLPEEEIHKNNFRKTILQPTFKVNYVKAIHMMKVPFHQHNDYVQIMIMVSGRVKVILCKQEVNLETNHTCIIPSKTNHSVETVGEDALFFEIFLPLI